METLYILQKQLSAAGGTGNDGVNSGVLEDIGHIHASKAPQKVNTARAPSRAAAET